MLDIKHLIQTLPEDPGVYRMLNAAEEVLYVGKAKNLRKRVSSYFQKTNLSPRIRLMVQQIEKVDITVTSSETEALLLENTLIKTLSPKFNILFRDDKSYAYIELSADEFSRVAFHRGRFQKGAHYFGPFPSSLAVRETIHLLQKVFQLRTCENTVFKNRSRPCLLHQIQRCTAPCVGRIQKDEYAATVHLVDLFLNGKPSEVIKHQTVAMEQASLALAFEKAAALRDQIRALQQLLHKQFVITTREENVDVIVAVLESGILCVNHAMIRAGRHLGDKAHFPQNALHCITAEALQAFIEQHYSAHTSIPTRILVNTQLSLQSLAELSLIVQNSKIIRQPHSEAEKAWLAMAEKNAKIAILTRQQSHASVNKKLVALQQALDQVMALPDEINRIECLDISHTQGEATVASCVVFSDGAMKRSEYRRYNIKDITPGDDYAAMRQALTRRFEKVAAGESRRPDLLLIDGGKGQLGIACEVLTELNLADIPAIGVAKGAARKLGDEELIIPGVSVPLKLEPSHPALLLIQEIRDEAHRFAITGHRARRAKARLHSQLEDVSGIGSVRRKRLLAEFGGLPGLKAATMSDLCRVEGISHTLAEKIYNELH